MFDGGYNSGYDIGCAFLKYVDQKGKTKDWEDKYPLNC